MQPLPDKGVYMHIKTTNEKGIKTALNFSKLR